jgi:hypothetical protein
MRYEKGISKALPTTEVLLGFEYSSQEGITVKFVQLNESFFINTF